MLSLCLLAGCGGSSGGGGVNGTPTPTPAPSPTPTTNASLTTLQFSEIFEGRAAANPYTATKPSGAATPTGMSANRQIDVKYDVASQSYTIVTNDRPDSTFSVANRVASQTTLTSTAYQKSNSATNVETLTLFNPGPNNAVLALTYSSYGVWQTNEDTGATVNGNTTLFVFGIETLPSDLPKTGTASYTTHLDGVFAGASGLYYLGGASSFSANFGAGTVAFSMTPVGTNLADSSTKSFGTLSGTGAINSAGPSFSADTGARAPGTYGAALLGQFFGPAAAEIGGTFTMIGDDGRGTGILIGKKQ